MPSSEFFNAVSKALAAKGAPKPCAVCGHPDFTYTRGLVYLIQQFGPAPMLHGLPHACVALVCNNCGNTVLIGLKTLGLEALLSEKDIWP